jgi:hypothetical protein
MGATSEIFIALQAQQVANLYDPSFTKREAVEAGKNLTRQVIDGGEVDKIQFAANLVRLKEVINAADSELRNHLTEKVKAFGVEFTPVDGGSTLNYTEDEIYCQLKADLDARAELLKLAQKQTVFDAYGNEVPKVGTTPRKSSVTIKF